VTTEVLAGRVVGEGSPTSDLSPAVLHDIVEQTLSVITPGDRVLAIIPDKTRDDNTDLLFPFASDFLGQRGVKNFDVLIAQGTHPPMSESQKLQKLGLSSFSGTLYDHRWNEPEELVTLGELSAEEVSSLTGGLLTKAVKVSLNKLLSPGVYDTVLVFGGTVPHEVAGFAGGAKYFFPGVAGPELTHMTHWLGALAEIENIIGQVETPTRQMIEAATDFVSAQIISLNTVVSRDSSDRLVTYALFGGDVREAFRRAAEVSRAVHIRFTNRKYKRVVALLDSHYDEMWVGGKASYKLGAIVEDGGELIIYAPHLTKLSETHGELIEKYGYAPLDVVRDMVGASSELRENLCIAAHLAHVSYASRLNERNEVVPRYGIVMATGISEEICRQVNLGFIDHRDVDFAAYDADPDTLIVDNAGRDLYLVGPPKTT
jgi:nickel-dependent lactate racemase